VLFFNAFELGAESRNQVFSSEEASRSIPEVFSTELTLGRVTVATVDA
jgi:hypothetical protein